MRPSIAPFQRSETSAAVSIELKHLRCVEVAERCGSFRKAADLIPLKQSVAHLRAPRSVAMKRAIIGATSLVGSTAWPLSRSRIRIGYEIAMQIAGNSRVSLTGLSSTYPLSFNLGIALLRSFRKAPGQDHD